MSRRAATGGRAHTKLLPDELTDDFHLRLLMATLLSKMGKS